MYRILYHRHIKSVPRPGYQIALILIEKTLLLFRQNKFALMLKQDVFS